MKANRHRQFVVRQDVRILFAFLMAAFGIFATVSLGNWQTRRAEQKLALQRQWDGLQNQAPQEIAASDLKALTDQLPKRVRMVGTWSETPAVWLENRALDGRAGFLLVMPLVLAPNAIVLVQRGWVARDPADRVRLPPVQTPAGVQQIEGVALPELPRLLDLGGKRSPGSLPAIWQNLDYETYERSSGLRVECVVVQQTDADAGGLQRRWPRPAFDVDKHRGYAFQWYCMACLIAILSVVLPVRARFSAVWKRKGWGRG